MQLAISSPVALPSRLRGRCVRRGLDSRVSMVTRPRGSGIHPESTGAAAQILQASSPSGFSWAWPAARALSSRRAALANQGRTRDRTENFSPLHSRWSAWDWRAWKAGTVLATSRTPDVRGCSPMKPAAAPLGQRLGGTSYYYCRTAELSLLCVLVALF
jgi:hypothetical protein